MNSNHDPARRGLLKAAGAALSPLILPRAARGANDRIALAFIGLGAMGGGNLGYAMKQPGIAVAALSDVYVPRLDKAMADAKAGGHDPKPVHDFRQILADRSIDAVCLSTPDHWHAYMAIEACKAGKDVWVEKPVSTTIDEGQRMVEAARKYGRVVQAGLMQRSGDVFQKAAEIVRSGALGRISFVRTWVYSNSPIEGMGAPADGDPPAELNWDLWQGPAPARRFNPNRFFHGNFRRFWDYAGGTMTDWGVHWLDIVQMANNDAMPSAAVAIGGKYVTTDNRETPDTMLATFEYPGFAAIFELKEYNGTGGGITFYGTNGTLFVNRSICQVTPEKNSSLAPFEMKRANSANLDHWANFLDCMKTRKHPICDIESGYRSSATCMLGNIALRSRMRVDWDGRTVKQSEAKALLSRANRHPWEITL